MSNGIATLQIIDGQMATSSTPKENSKKLMYYPAYKNEKGEDKNARLTIPVLVNLRNQEHPSNMLITAWGKMADVCAKALSPGRGISFTAEPRQYQTQYKIKGQPVLIEGKPLNMTGYSYTLKEISFGAESAGFIASEIGRGLRGADWFKPGSTDAQILSARRKEINSLELVQGMSTFGYATVNGYTSTPQVQIPNPTTQTANPLVNGLTPEILAAAMAIVQEQQQPITQTTPITVDEAPMQQATAPTVTIF